MVKHEKLQRSEKKVFFLLFFLDEKEIIISFANRRVFFVENTLALKVFFVQNTLILKVFFV